MPDDSRLLDLVLRWEELCQHGRKITPEQLCADCPELLPALRERLAALKAMNAMLTVRSPSISDAGSGTADSTVDDRSPKLQGDQGQLPSIAGYEILGELGRGGMGVVFKARQTALKRLVAIKMLLGGPNAADSDRVRFKAEVEAVARLQHPNFVQVFEVGEQDGRAFFSMEYVAGGNLDDKIALRPQPPRQAAELVAVLANAMHAAHECGIVHRDLKPANVLLAVDGTPKISDFGLAKRLGSATGPTLTQHVLGTPAYMAPEQASGHSKQVGPATDVYALGAILYEMLTGRPPFIGESVVEVARQVVDEEPVPPRRLQSSVPVNLDTICLKCLSKQAAERYPSAKALAEDLKQFLANEPILARPIGRLRRLAKWARRRPAAAGLIAFAAIALLTALGAGVWFTQRLAAELQKTETARQEEQASRRELQSALARQVAAALDADLRQLEMVPEAMAALLALREKWREEELEAWTRTLVDKDKRVFGIRVAFEPRRFEGKRVYDDYCLYVHEYKGGLSTKQLLPPGYPLPIYRERDWYNAPRLAKRPWWSEPYSSQGADNTPMVTYAVPFNRDGTFCGVVAADLSIEYFRSLHDGLKEQYLGQDSYGFVISAKGALVYHPDQRYEFPAPESTLDRLHATPEFIALMERMRREEAGRGQAVDFYTGRLATFSFARIPSTGWYFVAVHANSADDE